MEKTEVSQKIYKKTENEISKKIDAENKIKRKQEGKKIIKM